MLSNFEIGWMAGFFDGDGNVAIGRALGDPRAKAPYYSLMVTINNTKKEVLEYLWGIFGGSLKPVKKRPRIYVWVIQGEKAGEFLNLIYPHSKLKRKEIEIANKFLSLPRQPGSKRVPLELTQLREQCLQEIKALHYPGRGRPQVRPFILQ